MIEKALNYDHKNEPKRGDIYYADLSGNQGSEQGGVRPVLIVQNDTGNKHSPATIALAITSKMYKANFPTHVIISSNDSGLPTTSIVLAEQVRTVDKTRLKSKVGHLREDQMIKVVSAILISYGILNSVPVAS